MNAIKIINRRRNKREGKRNTININVWMEHFIKHFINLLRRQTGCTKRKKMMSERGGNKECSLEERRN